MFSATRRALTTRAITPVFTRTVARNMASVTPAQIEIVKATAPVLKEHGTTITTVFYQNMLGNNPELKNIFSITSQANGRQPRALANAVLGYATYIDNLPVLTHAVERIAHKHASLFVTPEQYNIVGKYLLEAIGQVLGPAATPEIVDAWTNAYAVLAEVFIKREGQLYADNGAWQGWRKFKIAKKVTEAENIISLYLAPVDGAKLPDFLPGQYISLQVTPPGLDFFQSRQYSMSTAPRKDGDYYRVSVKREEGTAANLPPGMVSNMLHDAIKEGDVVELSHPQGEFFFNPAEKAGVPLVLVSAGVGATPMMSILEAHVGKRPISWIQAAFNEGRLPFGDEVKAVAEAHPESVKASVFVEHDAHVGQYKGFATEYEGRIALENMDKEKDLFIGNPEAEYALCGPEEWMVAMKTGLVGMGVSGDRVKMELFETGDVQE